MKNEKRKEKERLRGEQKVEGYQERKVLFDFLNCNLVLHVSVNNVRGKGSWSRVSDSAGGHQASPESLLLGCLEDSGAGLLVRID